MWWTKSTTPKSPRHSDSARDRVVVQIHCGSRGLGHEVCGQYIRVLQDAPRRYGIDIPDRELVAAPVDSREGRDYLAAMAAAANYAFANRQILAHFVRRSFEQVLAGKVRDWNLHQVYDVTHNIAKIEEHQVGKQQDESRGSPQRSDARLPRHATPISPPSTGRRDNLSWSPVQWGRYPTCWWERRPR